MKELNNTTISDDKNLAIYQELKVVIKRLRNIHEMVFKEQNLTPIEGMICYSLYKFQCENKIISISEIAKNNDVTIPAIMHKLTNLEKKGLIYKYSLDDDKRTKYIRLTDLAIQSFEQTIKKFDLIFLSVLNALDDEDIKDLKRIMAKLNKMMEEYNV